MKSVIGNPQSAMFHASPVANPANSKLKIKNSKFDPSLALLCVRASSRAYVTATDSEPSTDTQYLLLELPDRIIVAFRGTSSLQDFICDANFFTTRININFDERVHLGFYRAYKSIENRLKKRIDEIISRRSGFSQIGTTVREADASYGQLTSGGLGEANPQSAIRNTPIVFTGHSLGGALALLAAFYLSHAYHIESIYTFGAPDVGNAAFATRYNHLRYPCLSVPLSGRSKSSVSLGQKTYCLANACDPVTWLPPYRFGYRRVGKFFFLPGVDWLKSGFHLPPIARLIAGTLQVLKNWRHGKLALLTNHSLSLYATRVEQLSKN